MADVIIQCATAGSVYKGMCEDHAKRHDAYAAKWNFKIADGESFEPDSWFKLYMARDIMAEVREGTLVVLLDADAFICDMNTDIRTALPDWAWLGLVKHPYPAYNQATHWNVGMSYWRACPQAIQFIDDVIAMRRDGAPEEQFAINALLWGGRQEGFCDLPRQFNNNWHDMSHDQAVVMAFHGYLQPEDRRELMKLVAAKYPY